MPTLFLYILQASGCMTLLYLLYIACFKKETFYRYNRLLLLSAFICSAIFPLLPIPAFQWASTPATDTPHTMVYFNNTPSAQVHTSVHPGAVAHPWWEPFVQHAVTGMLAVYLIVAGILLLIHVWQLVKIWQLAQTGQANTQNNIRYVQINGLTAPFSFLRTIFFDANAHEPTELQHILRHEEAHVQQYHSVDILLSSLYCCLCWINPFAWRCKKSLQLNLEFLADEAALLTFDTPTAYQYSLIKMSALRSPVAIVNHFGKSFIKNRILMMNKTQSSRKRTWRYLLLLPVLALMAGLLSATTNEIAQPGADKYLVTENGVIHGMITRLTTDEDLANMKTVLASKGIHITWPVLKRNTAGEITNIRFEAKDKRSGLVETLDDNPISAFFFFFAENESGIGDTPFKRTPQSLLNRAIAESNGRTKGITTDSTFRQRFPGGNEGYTKFLARNVRYPRHCQEHNIVGNVITQYQILPSGEVTNVEVLLSPDKMMGDEVVRIIKMMPVFKPDVAGKTVTVALTIAFQLEVSGKALKSPDVIQDGAVVVTGYGKQ